MLLQIMIVNAYIANRFSLPETLHWIRSAHYVYIKPEKSKEKRNPGR